MGDSLLQALHEQQKIIEQQSRLIVDLVAALKTGRTWRDTMARG